MTNLIQKTKDIAKRGLQFSLVIPLSAAIIGCSTKEVPNIPYQGYKTNDEGSANHYSLVFDEKTREERGMQSPELDLAGDPKMKNTEGDTLSIGTRYKVTYTDYWLGENKIQKVEKIKTNLAR
jgi:hypothetical protein